MEDELAAIRERRMQELSRQFNHGPSPVAGNGGARTHPTEVDLETIGAFLENHPIVLVDVWASWCGPCRMMEPVIEELAEEWKGRVGVAKLNADKDPDFLAQYGIQGIPNFLFFKDGRFIGRLVGARPKGDFVAALAEVEASVPDPATV